MIVLLLAMLLIVGCSSEVVKTDIEVEPVVESMYPMTITDSYDREITIESEPMRVVSMAPSISETIFSRNFAALPWDSIFCFCSLNFSIIALP